MQAGARARGAGFARSFLVLAVSSGIVVLTACGSDDPPAASSACDNARCLPGNSCLPLGGEVKCRKTCQSNDDPATSCPLGYICSDTNPAEGVPPFCIQSTAAFDTADGRAPVTPKESGQWGTPCLANLGARNPACDLEQGFYCHALSPSDGEAYCTSFGCESNTDCGAGFACETVNAFPNANTAKRKSPGKSETQRACVRRGYCAACTSDIDCPAIAGRKQHCIEDQKKRRFCAPECSSTSSCPLEATCATYRGPDRDYPICFPRGGACLGDGRLCSPCRSDQDCAEDGICVKGEFTTERFCAIKAPSPNCGDCPDAPVVPNRAIGCFRVDQDKIPAGYCTGFVSIGDNPSADIGCFTPNR